MTTWTFGWRVAVHDVVRDAVERVAAPGVLAEVGVEPAVAVEADDVVDDRGRVGGHRGVGDLLVPGVVGREELLAQQRQQLASLQRLDGGERPARGLRVSEGPRRADGRAVLNMAQSPEATEHRHSGTR